MNHIEALRICRDALQDVAEKVLVWPEDRAKQAFIDTAVIDPVAESIESESFNTRLLCYRSAMTIGSADSDRSAIIRAVDAHCAAQVALALAASDPMAAANQAGAVNMKKVMVAPSHSPK